MTLNCLMAIILHYSTELGSFGANYYGHSLTRELWRPQTSAKANLIRIPIQIRSSSGWILKFNGDFLVQGYTQSGAE